LSIYTGDCSLFGVLCHVISRSVSETGGAMSR
jgi:hypothetical protein